MLKRALLGAAAVLGVLGILFFSASTFGFLARFEDPKFRVAIRNTRLNGNLFTGLAYQFHHGIQPARLAFFVHGNQVGVEHRWHANGTKAFEGRYVDGLPHGEHRLWYPNGRVQFLKNFVHGVNHGEFWGWHPNGTVSDFRLFENGKGIAYKSWISDGKPFYNYVFQDGLPVGVRGGSFCKRRRVVN